MGIANLLSDPWSQATVIGPGLGFWPKPDQSESLPGVMFSVGFVPLKRMWKFNPHCEVLKSENLVKMWCLKMEP